MREVRDPEGLPRRERSRRRPAAGVLASVAVLASGMVVVGVGAPSSVLHARPVGLDPVAVALTHLRTLSADVPGASAAPGLVPEDTDDLVVLDTTRLSGAPGVSVVYVQQRLDGIDVDGAISSVAVGPDGTLVHAAERLVPRLRERAGTPPTPAVLKPTGAVQAAARAVGLRPTRPVVVLDSPTGAMQAAEVSGSGIAEAPIPLHLTYVADSRGALRLAWEVLIEEADDTSVWNVHVDAATGEELGSEDLVQHAAPDADADGATYTVFAPPVESPTFGGRSVLTSPADPSASPFGWHDTDGGPGAEWTVTRGNNVKAYLDLDGDNKVDVGGQPDGGPGLVFDFPLDLSRPPRDYRPAAVTNLFVWNSYVHDVMWHYGFDEASGNFQVLNYTGKGLGGDAVRAEAQDGSGVDNANFYTPPDGKPPRMQMYTWSSPVPDRDGDLDNGVVVHEFAHGITTRLTGSRLDSTCLANDEQPGEGWSDWYALMLTADPADPVPSRRGIGTYVMNQPASGTGIRAFPYSTSLTTDPRTYASIRGLAGDPHSVGSVFAAMLWEMSASLIAEYGYDPDVASGTGGNNRALRLVTDGLKLQPCNPGFVDARDAILAADRAATGGVDSCLIWTAFAKRGLGASASQGDERTVADAVEAFDLPTECQPVAVTTSRSAVSAGSDVTVTLTARNPLPRSTLDGNVLTLAVPDGATPVPGTSTCAGTPTPDGLTFTLGSLAPGQMVRCRVTLATPATRWTRVGLADGFDDGLGRWHLAGTGASWSLDGSSSVSPPASVRAAAVGRVSDQQLVLRRAVRVRSGDQLRFTHRFDTELGFDGGIVQYTTDGTTWRDLGPLMSTFGYTARLSNDYGNPLAGRRAYTGASGGWRRSIADLSSLAGSSILVRFRMGTDSSLGDRGWSIDDVTIGSFVDLAVQARLTDASAVQHRSTATVRLTAPRCAGRAVTVNLALGQSPSRGPDVILGTPGDDEIDAGRGDDVVCAGRGDDVVRGGSGDDELVGGDGTDACAGDDGTDAARECESVTGVP